MCLEAGVSSPAKPCNPEADIGATFSHEYTSAHANTLYVLMPFVLSRSSSPFIPSVRTVPGLEFSRIKLMKSRPKSHIDVLDSVLVED